jgi:uracil-DNA glycosylase
MENIHNSWLPLFKNYNFDIDELYNSGKKIYPPKNLIFRIFELDVKKIKVVLLGQDPYHGVGQAHGLSFSVPNDQKIPPSLRNIFKELKSCFPDRNYQFKTGNLERWFNQEGIFLYNCSLSVEERKPGSHMKIWEEFTNNVIQYISKNNDKCVFLLLGKFAQSKKEFILNEDKIISVPHPSPLARGFIGSDCFLQLEKILGNEINWEI